MHRRITTRAINDHSGRQAVLLVGSQFSLAVIICLGDSFPLPTTVRSDRAAMNTIIRALAPPIAVALAGSTLLAETAPTSHSNRTAPISAELAKRCRALAIKAHPTQPAGTRNAWGQAQRDYFQECVAKSGDMQDAIPARRGCRSRTCQSAAAVFVGELACP